MNLFNLKQESTVQRYLDPIPMAEPLPPGVKKIYFVDASLLKYAPCMLKVWRTGVEGRKGKINSVDIEYGSAFHLFAQHYTDTKGTNLRESIQKATDYFTSTPSIPKDKKAWMTVTHLKKTCFDWMTHWEKTQDNLEALKVDGCPTTELKFDLPYYQDDKYEIHLAGTIDRICKTKGSGPYVLTDYKTTSSWDNKSYLAQYRLDPQLRFYRLAISLYAQAYPNSIYADMVAKGCGCLIEGIFLKATEEATIRRSDTMFFKAAEMQQFEGLVKKFISRFVEALNAPEEPPKEGILSGYCYGAKFGCHFVDACGAPDKIAEQHVLRNNFITKPYNPLLFR